MYIFYFIFLIKFGEKSLKSICFSFKSTRLQTSTIDMQYVHTFRSIRSALSKLFFQNFINPTICQFSNSNFFSLIQLRDLVQRSIARKSLILLLLKFCEEIFTQAHYRQFFSVFSKSIFWTGHVLEKRS